MAKTAPKKTNKNDPLTGIKCRPEAMLVQKSNPLYGLWRSDLGLAEFKIIDVYLARIDSHDPEHRTVRFEKGEIEKLLGVKKINKADLTTRLKRLGTLVPIEDPTQRDDVRLISLFECADGHKDEDGRWSVELTCTRQARKYIFGIERLGYFRYKLRSVRNLRSRYAYIMFMYLEKNRHMHLSWEVKVDELRNLLKADGEVYQQFKRFNDRLLKPVQKELLEKTECRFSYKPDPKGGRTIKAIQFTLEPLAEDIVAADQMVIEAPGIPIGGSLNLLRAACTDDAGKCQLDDAALRSIDALLEMVPSGMLPNPDELDPQKRRAVYLRYVYKKACAEAEKKNRSGGKIVFLGKYIEAVIKKEINDWQSVQKDATETGASSGIAGYKDGDEFFDAALKAGMGA